MTLTINRASLRALVYTAISVLYALISPAKAAQPSCFVQAETYYEQIYCEIKQKDPGHSLPAFYDFKKNDQMTQALLLKRKAKALHISFKMPERVPERMQKGTPQRALAKTQGKPQTNKAKRSEESAGCSLQAQRISCHQSHYIQTGNRSNRFINKAALSQENKMGLSLYENKGPYTGKSNNRDAINTYLFTAYVRYLEKMLEIGLGGVTMSYTKFHILFHDLLEKEVDFASRFETMYSFLKKDKSEIGVSENVEPIQQLSIKDCTQLTPQMFTCDNRYRNAIYLRK